MDIKDIRIGDVIEYQDPDTLELTGGKVCRLIPENGGWVELIEDDDLPHVASWGILRIVSREGEHEDESPCECEGNGPAVNAMGCPVHGGRS